ncbi:MAG: bifunctional UDP-N-acetylmuramoyl-tripeptide:D-alanyl-D-alanine ligase/alanine racemase [Flavobacteriales bacterium]|nr:bifunctional UDP-N-acetylmuramoyl-tripeptide:D-alanyl-D-alanine ligase/alanine racemase [Flavobacteriales bacterium]MBK6944662.1 bifunctional UDP-N-acetylmuramoyl-tripeptide:D-alanyl-D-alanine ligase/alanine racemase [Flavobacteriales bacterium]MBK9534317.1 bifunctional UDP-N-acetylmuramoyl-tripeptide:D-alanyl-D-alanine ligase/alanine racemase [Flavobacteriales bacterium]MBP9137261.1 bifunctional UDP-N-acetylmuramoyl-tripeptide:D-alanyl-D-alanine ligase/alanine racemase [Flavobacteriales bact
MATRGHRLSAIAAALGVAYDQMGEDPLIEHISIDSRKPYPPESTLFIALHGERHDGHAYLNELADRGMRYFLVNASSTVDLPFPVLRVRDTLRALQRLAGWHRAHFRAPVVGITGSNGKTVVKEWLYQLLRGKEHIVRSPGSWNSQVGVPLSVWELGPEHTLGLFEAGISKRGEMERLRSVIRPTIGVITNVGPAHGENFKDDHEKAVEKLGLFHDVDVLIYCADHKVIAEALERTGLAQRVTELGWSRENSGWLHVLHEETLQDRTLITVSRANDQFTFEIPFTDHASVENVLHCVALLLHLGHDPAWIAERTPHLTPVAMRLEVLDGVNGTTLINDAYSNDEASFAIALDHLGMVAQGRPKTVVLTDMIESGGNALSLYQRVADRMIRSGVERVIGIGPQLNAHRALFPSASLFFADTTSALNGVDTAAFAGHAILIKGARTFALERLVQHWQRQVHGTVLEIDLEAVRHNLNHYRGLISPPTRTMAMVKAFGYGSGALELARLFAHEQVHYLGVAYADEGVELRQNGIRLPILVMNPEPVPFEALQRFRLEAEVFDLRSLDEAERMIQQHGEAPPIHIKLDTGMHRLGFTAHELPELIDRLRQNRKLNIVGIFSHLAASEDPALDAFTREQIASFTNMADAICDVVDTVPLRHIANTASISRFPKAHFDMVRLGIGLHGIASSAHEMAALRTTTTLQSPIAQLKTLAPGDTVGYGRTWKADSVVRIATLPIGYADGLSRRLSNGKGRVWINGRAAPIVGNVCMDMVMVDVTTIPCSSDDMAIIFSPDHPVTELAKDMDTIPYEVLTSIAPRVKRVYLHG